VRNVLAGLLVNNDKGTTISQIPAISSGDFGSVTPANLASVLGAITGIQGQRYLDYGSTGWLRKVSCDATKYNNKVCMLVIYGIHGELAIVNPTFDENMALLYKNNRNSIRIYRDLSYNLYIWQSSYTPYNILPIGVSSLTIDKSSIDVSTLTEITFNN
jgi:hypothetical protein